MTNQAANQEKLDQVWSKAALYRTGLELQADPTIAGPHGLIAKTARIGACWSGILTLKGDITKTLARLQAAQIDLKREKSVRLSLMLDGIMSDEGLRAVRTIPARLRAKLNVRTSDIDSQIEANESAQIELKALKEHLDDLILRARAAKELLRTQVDLSVGHRLADATVAKGFEE